MAAYLQTPQAIKRRRAFFGALVPLFGREAALEAIEIWENTFGSEQPLLRGISQFSSLVVAELNLNILSADLSVILLEHLQRDDSKLPPDPLPLLQSGTGTSRDPAQPAPTAPATPPATKPGANKRVSSPLTATLATLLLKLCDTAGQAGNKTQAALIKSFIRSCETNLNAEIAEDISQLLSGRRTALAIDYSKKGAIALINAFYVALAEFYGPISADRIMTSSVRAVEETPEGRAFAPRELL